MIRSISCTYIISGKKFSPDSLAIPKTINILQRYNIGEIIEFGRYKGSLATEGFLVLEGTINDILIFAEQIKETDDSNICLTICYKDQCNFELSQEHLQRFAFLGIPLGITCYEEDK